VSFKINKIEAILFIKQKKLVKKTQLARINLKGKKIKFNSEATKWLKI
jgi:hypothetical protein